MAVDERARHELYEQLTEVLGAKATGTLMELLPPGGWDAVATKDDLARLEARMDARFAAIDGRFEAIDGRFEGVESRFETIDRRFETVEAKIEASREAVIAVVRGELNAAITSQTRTMVFTMAGTVVALGGLALSLARL